MARKQMVSPPEEGSEAPEFNLPGAHGGQLRLNLRTARGPVIVAFYRGSWSGECVEYFEALSKKEREINVAGATLVGIGAVEPEEAREFVRATGFKSYILYDYVRVASREYGLLQKDAEHGDTVLPAVFLIGSDHKVLRAWLDERPSPDDLLSEVSRVTGLPKKPEEEEEGEEKPRKRPRKPAETAETSEPAEPAEPAKDEAEAGEKPAPQDEAKSGEKRAAAASRETSPESTETGDGEEAKPGEEPESSREGKDDPERGAER